EQPILDVAKILQDYVWDSFKALPENRLARPFLRRKSYSVDVPMSYFVFETLSHRQELTPRVRSELGDLAHILDSKNRDKKVKEHEKLVTSDTYYENKTNVEQTYKFRLEKTRKASLSVTFTRGFTINGNARFSIKLPPADCGPSGDLGCTFNISKATTEVIEETVVLETTSDIHVEKNSKFVARVALAESEVMYDFKVSTLMRFASDCALGTVTRKSDNRVFYSTAIKNLNDVFRGFILPLDTKHETQQYAIELTTVGVLDGVRLSNQYIFLESLPLSGEN
ncbi:unnamed protein product, partial [Lymnaea stagnalis]